MAVPHNSLRIVLQLELHEGAAQNNQRNKFITLINTLGHADKQAHKYANIRKKGQTTRLSFADVTEDDTNLR
jgi:hypothetical protein